LGFGSERAASSSLRRLSIARQAFVAYGRGSGHPAKLTIGDLFS
jgi:uncharacterized protein with PIN domain